MQGGEGKTTAHPHFVFFAPLYAFFLFIGQNLASGEESVAAHAAYSKQRQYFFIFLMKKDWDF